MTRFTLFAAAIALTTFASCAKDEVATPDNCYESTVAGTYGTVTGTVQAPGQLSTQELSDSESTLVITGTDCNAVKIQIGSTVGGFAADCSAPVNNIMTGTSADNASDYSYNTSTKIITVKYTASTGVVYTVSGRK